MRDNVISRREGVNEEHRHLCKIDGKCIPAPRGAWWAVFQAHIHTKLVHRRHRPAQQAKDIGRNDMRAILSLLAVSMAIAIGFVPLQARAANRFSLSVANVSGSYSFRFSGQELIPGIAHQIAGVGVFVADGRGKIIGGSLTYNDGGNACGFRLTEGFYQVSADGEGSLSLKGSKENEAVLCHFAGGFEFYIALGNVVNGIAQTLELASSLFYRTRHKGGQPSPT